MKFETIGFSKRYLERQWDKVSRIRDQSNKKFQSFSFIEHILPILEKTEQISKLENT